MDNLKYCLVNRGEWFERKAIAQLYKSEISEATSILRDMLNDKYEDVRVTEKTELIQNLILLKEKMRRSKEEEKVREWVNNGLAMFVEVLRASNENIEQFCTEVIMKLAKYVQASRGVMYIPNEGSKELKIISGYGYSVEHLLSDTIQLQEGLIGQVYASGNKLMIHKVPYSYYAIQSGLGEALPTFLLIVPLKLNQDVFGVIELAFLKELESYRVDFIERLGENIAASLYAATMNARTKKLLDESLQKEEKLLEQETAMKESLNELHLVQEKMKQQEEEMIKNMEDLVMQMQEEALLKEQQLLDRIRALEAKQV